MKEWIRDGYKVLEKGFDFDLHVFDIEVNGEKTATIYPQTVEEMEGIINDLDAGEDVNGWEDGLGNTISLPSL